MGCKPKALLPVENSVVQLDPATADPGHFCKRLFSASATMILPAASASAEKGQRNCVEPAPCPLVPATVVHGVPGGLEGHRCTRLLRQSAMRKLPIASTAAPTGLLS